MVSSVGSRGHFDALSRRIPECIVWSVFAWLRMRDRLPLMRQTSAYAGDLSAEQDAIRKEVRTVEME
jgi:hypothetical protein